MVCIAPVHNGMSQQTGHFYAQAFRRFGQWMFDQGYINRPPKIRSVSVGKNYGGCFELHEFEALLKAAWTGPERYGMTGHQRYILYVVAYEAGLYVVAYEAGLPMHIRRGLRP